MKARSTHPTRSLGHLIAALSLLALCAGCAMSNGPTERQKAKRASSFVDLGADHLKNGRPGLALREFLHAESLESGDPRIHYGLAEAYWARDRLDDAERHFRQALEIYPDHHDSRMSLSALMIRSGRYAEAIEQCRILVEDAKDGGL